MAAEFQAIILAGGSGIRMYPLTEDTPKCLLPANGRPLLWYQLNLLEKSGFTQVLVVTVGSMVAQIQDYVSREYDGKILVEICEVEENCETAEALREISDKIKTDFMVLAGDLITDVVVHNLADCHRINDASVTMLLKQNPTQQALKVKGEKPRRDKDLTDCIGLVPGDNRVVYLSQAVHMMEDIYLNKTLMTRQRNFVLHSDLYDAHFYVFSHWVLDLLQEKKYLASIKADLLPHLIHRQFRGKDVLSEAIRDKAVNHQQLANSLSVSTHEKEALENDLIRCFAYTLPLNGYCERADTIAAYEAMEKEVPSLRMARRSSF